MAMATTVGTLPEAEHSAQLRKAVIASTVGTAIEWYDFFLYGTAAGLVFGKLYFPNEAPLAGVLLAFGTYFIGFVGRPIGAAIFGHYGDRIGRKATLIATLMCMGLATFAIAFVPTYASIGIWGAILLTVLRMIQGIGVGGEWGGSVLLGDGMVAHAEPTRPDCVLAAIRRALRLAVVEFRDPGFQHLGGRRLPYLGLAHSVRALDHSGRHWPVDPAWHSRDASIPGNLGQRQKSRRPRSSK